MSGGAREEMPAEVPVVPAARGWYVSTPREADALDYAADEGSERCDA